MKWWMGLPPQVKRVCRRAIRPLPWVTRMAWQRLVLPERQKFAFAAFGGVEGDDMVADSDAGDARADRFDDAAAFVT